MLKAHAYAFPVQSMMKSFKSGTKSLSLKGSPVTCTEGQPFSPHRQSEASVANGEQFLGTPCTSCAGPSLGPQLSVATQVLAEQLQLPNLPASHSRCQQCGALVSGSWAPVVRTSAEAATEPLPAAQGQAVQGRGVELKRSSVHVRAALPVKLLMAPFGDQVRISRSGGHETAVKAAAHLQMHADKAVTVSLTCSCLLS